MHHPLYLNARSVVRLLAALMFVSLLIGGFPPLGVSAGSRSSPTTTATAVGPLATRGTAGITPEAALRRVLTIRPIQASWFAPSFLAVANAAQIEQGLASITTQLGPYKRLTPVPDGVFQVQFRDGTVDSFIH